MVDNIKYFYTYSKHPRTLNIMRRLYLMRANVLISNYDYDSSLKYQRLAMELSFREFFILVDFDEGLSQFNKMSNKTLLFKKLLKENFIDLIICVRNQKYAASDNKKKKGVTLTVIKIKKTGDKLSPLKI